MPGRPGLEIGTIQERFDHQGRSRHDARNGEPIFTIASVATDTDGDEKGEEVVRPSTDGRDPRIYTSPPTGRRLVTFRHDPQYRMAVAWQNTAYNQSPHPSFYLDESAPLPARPVVDFPAFAGCGRRAVAPPPPLMKCNEGVGDHLRKFRAYRHEIEAQRRAQRN